MTSWLEDNPVHWTVSIYTKTLMDWFTGLSCEMSCMFLVKRLFVVRAISEAESKCIMLLSKDNKYGFTHSRDKPLSSLQLLISVRSSSSYLLLIIINNARRHTGNDSFYLIFGLLVNFLPCFLPWLVDYINTEVYLVDLVHGRSFPISFCRCFVCKYLIPIR